MYEGISALISQFECLLIGIIIDAWYETYLSAETLGGLHLADRRTLWQADEALHAHGGSTESHALSVVACRTSDYSLCLLLVGELGNLIISTTNLERTRLLKTLRLQIYITFWVDSRGVNQLSLSDYFAQHEASLVEIV